MNYQKPQLTLIGSAITAIQAGVMKDQAAHDGSQLSVDAYVSDEA